MSIELIKTSRDNFYVSFEEFFKQNPDEYFTSGSIAKILGESSTPQQSGHKNWVYMSIMDHLVHQKKLDVYKYQSKKSDRVYKNVYKYGTGDVIFIKQK